MTRRSQAVLMQVSFCAGLHNIIDLKLLRRALPSRSLRAASLPYSAPATLATVPLSRTLWRQDHHRT